MQLGGGSLTILTLDDWSEESQHHRWIANLDTWQQPQDSWLRVRVPAVLRCFAAMAHVCNVLQAVGIETRDASPPSEGTIA